MKILFLHGLESSPESTKVSFLRQLGHSVYAPSLGRWSFEESALIAQAAFDGYKPDVVVGSSRGGALAMQLEAAGSNMILIAPAWQKYEVPPAVPKSAKLLHSVDDDVVPLQHSVMLSLTLDTGALRVVGDSHRMSDKTALEALARAISEVDDHEG